MYHTFLENMLLFKKIYDEALDPVAQDCGLTRMELDLLLFLHNNPEHNTAADAVHLRRWTKSHVSSAVHALEEKGLLTANHQPGNRKTLRLVPLPAADGIISRGAAAQNRFASILNQGVTPEEAALVERVTQKITQNIRQFEKK